MKPAFFSLALLISAAFADSTTISGSRIPIQSQVYWNTSTEVAVLQNTVKRKSGGALISSDSCSNSISLSAGGVYPTSVMVLRYEARASDPTESGLKMRLDSRDCLNPSDNNTCDNIWTQQGHSFLYDTVKVADSLTVSDVPADWTAYKRYFYFASGDQMRVCITQNGIGIGDTTFLSNMTFKGK